VSGALLTVEAVTVLRLTAEVLNEQGLRAAVRLLDEPATQAVYLDLGRVRLPTAEGLGVLATMNRELRARGGGLVLFNVPADTREVLEVTHLVEVIDVRPAVSGDATR
jgi:anti-anti-sigma factor